MKRLRYQCSSCGARDVKLWRQYNTMADYLDLLCRGCAEGDQGEMLGDGDMIGSLVPAVPTELPDKKGRIPRGATFWGCTSVPGWGVKWWHELPPQIPHGIDLSALPTREEEEAEQARRIVIREQQFKKKIDETVYVVEASQEEQTMIWLKWHTVLDIAQDACGFGETIGSLLRKPIAVSVSWLIIEGLRVAFYEPTSRYVDHDVVRAWVNKTFPIMQREHAHCNVANFHHCLAAVAPDWSKDGNKHAQFRRIHETLSGRRKVSATKIVSWARR